MDRMMAEMAKALPSNTIIADEAVTSRGAMLGALDFDEPGSMHAIQGGGLGWAMGGALGIKLAHPDRPVVAVVGDGASLYTIQALWTAARYNIPVTYVICNNRTYRILKQNMDIYLRDMLDDKERVSEYVGMDFPLPLDVAGIARGFGVNGVTSDQARGRGPRDGEGLGIGCASSGGCGHRQRAPTLGPLPRVSSVPTFPLGGGKGYAKGIIFDGTEGTRSLAERQYREQEGQRQKKGPSFIG